MDDSFRFASGSNCGLIWDEVRLNLGVSGNILCQETANKSAKKQTYSYRADFGMAILTKSDEERACEPVAIEGRNLTIHTLVDEFCKFSECRSVGEPGCMVIYGEA